MKVLHGKDLGPKFFALALILLLSCLPVSILVVNFIQKSYFQPEYFLVFSTPKVAYLLFIIGYILLFVIFGITLYIIDSKVTYKLLLLCLALFVTSIVFIYQAFTSFSYFNENEIKINQPFSREKTVEWDSIQKVTQINKGGTPYQLEFLLLEEKNPHFNLQVDWFLKRKVFYQLLREQNIEIESREKE